MEGLGEKFQSQLNTGSFTCQIPVKLPPMRGGVPSLSLEYNLSWPWAFGNCGLRPSSVRLKRWQSQGSQALVQYLPVNADAVRQQMRVSGAQIRHESAPMTTLQNPHATHDGHALRLTQSPGRAFVNDGEIGRERAGQQDGGEFSGTECMAGSQGGESVGIGRRVSFNPVRARHRPGGGPAGTAHDDFLTHFAGNMDAPEKLPQQVEPANAGERDERGGIGNDDHSLRRSAVAWSSARSAAV
jgi:hypothetical protein